jgi:hypothetical protein
MVNVLAMPNQKIVAMYRINQIIILHCFDGNLLMGFFLAFATLFGLEMS